MKSIYSIFGGFKNLIASVAQILIAIILLPFICFILHLLMPESSFGFFVNLLSEVPFMDTWFEVVTNFSTSSFSGGAFTGYFNQVFAPMGTTIIEAMVMGMCVYMCKMIGTLAYVRGVPVIQSVCGVFLGCIVINSIGKDNIPYTVLAASFMVLADILLTVFAAKGQVLQKVLGIFFGIALHSLIAGMACAYVAVLTLIIRGQSGSLAVSLGLIGATLCPLLIALLLDYFLATPKKLSL